MSQVALVTGANRGIGLATARALRDAGFTVAATYRSTPIDEDGITAIRCDVTDVESVDAAFSCLLYTSPSPRDGLLSRMPSSA